MKKSVFLSMMCIVFAMTQAQENKVSNESVNAVVQFNQIVHDFGVVNESDGIIECDFIVMNNSDKPLVVNRISTECGCTVPSWTKKPINSGEKGFIKVTFDPKGRIGNFTKSLSVFTSAQSSPARLTIKGKIEQTAMAQN